MCPYLGESIEGYTVLPILFIVGPFVYTQVQNSKISSLNQVGMSLTKKMRQNSKSLKNLEGN